MDHLRYSILIRMALPEYSYSPKRQVLKTADVQAAAAVTNTNYNHIEFIKGDEGIIAFITFLF